MPNVISKKSLEVRFFAPGNLVSNLDFVESIFGNAGNPNLALNDAALDTEHWIESHRLYCFSSPINNTKEERCRTTSF
ncbi:hypothetical protein [Thalassobellus suaedae]|uniref:Uncharacterized protein n=1 Tax=Thalassobellus suaedae TaxID=3074124 RepID=A0ABY9XQV9_9FLAO|nr:hypothetical protein RHP51_14335 [Flavobacteriaceae bacterium HL-DH14]